MTRLYASFALAALALMAAPHVVSAGRATIRVTNAIVATAAADLLDGKKEWALDAVSCGVELISKETNR